MAKKKRNESVHSPYRVDRNRLEEQSEDQPELMHEAATMLADAKEQVDTLKDELEVIRCTLDKEIREDPKEFGIEKATEDAIKNTIPLQKSYQRALTKLRAAKHLADRIAADVEGFKHRKAMIESMGYLYGLDYFSAPKDRAAKLRTMRTPRDEDEEDEE